MVVLASNSHIDNALARVDTHIAETKELLRVVKEARNNLSCAVRVPPEILAHIFLYIVEEMYEHNNKNSISQLYLPHVCRYWYQVASHSQQYWRYQPLRLEENRRFHSPHIVKRAGGRPLHLWGNAWARPPWLEDHSECELVSQQLSQAESINIVIYHNIPIHAPRALSNDDPPYLSPFLKRKAPNLKALSLSIQTNERFPIDADAFEGETPNLSSLFLSGFSWSWSAPLFPPSLTSLILYGPVIWGNECVETLRLLPFLRHLELTDTYAPRKQDRGIIVPIHHTPSIKLEHLKTLKLKGGQVDMAKLSLELDVPSSTIISLTSPHFLTIPKDDDTCSEFEPLFSFASRCIERRQRGHTFPSVLHIKSSDSVYARDLTFRLWGQCTRITDGSGLFKTVDTTPAFQLTLNAYYARVRDMRACVTLYSGWMLRRAIPHLPLTEVHTLYLEHLPSAVDSRTAFEGLSSVQTLCVYDRKKSCVFQDLITALPNGEDSHKGDSDQEDVLFPALNTVILLNTYLSLSQGWDQLLEFVAERARLNHAVPTLCLVKCYPVSAQCLEELRQHVANVVWDGYGVKALKLSDSDDDLSMYSESDYED